MESNIIVTIIVILYLLVMLFIGWYSSKRIKSNVDFVVAGRSLGPWMIAGTLAATQIGGGSSLGVVQQGMQSHGLSGAWYIITMGIAYAILAFWAPKLRRSNVKTVPEFFRRRYGNAAGIIQTILNIIALFGSTVAQYTASAIIISVMLNIDFQVALIIATVVVTVYSVMGGLWSVTITDFVQMFLILFGMFIAMPFAGRFAGGWSNVVANVPADTFNLFKGYDLLAIVSLTIMYLTSFASGQITVSRFFAARDSKAAKQGSFIAAGVNVVYAFVPAILGIIVLALINMGRFNADSFAGVGARYALPVLAMESMPPIIVGLLFAGIVSATMSTIDSVLLGGGTIFGIDIYKRYINKNASDKQVMNVTKIVMVVVSLISLVLALFNTASILQLLQFAFTATAATAFVPYILGHYWKKASQAGAIASMIGGALSVVAFDILWPGILAIHTIIPSIAISFVGYVLFSLLFPPKTETLELAPEDGALEDNTDK